MRFQWLRLGETEQEKRTAREYKITHIKYPRAHIDLNKKLNKSFVRARVKLFYNKLPIYKIRRNDRDKNTSGKHHGDVFCRQASPTGTSIRGQQLWRRLSQQVLATLLGPQSPYHTHQCHIIAVLVLQRQRLRT